MAEFQGVPVHDFKQTLDVNEGAGHNHQYTVPAGKKLLLWQVLASTDSSFIVEVKTGPAAGLINKAAIRITQNKPNDDVAFESPVEVGPGDIVNVDATNRGLQGDVNTTIVGDLIAA